MVALFKCFQTLLWIEMSEIWIWQPVFLTLEILNIG